MFAKLAKWREYTQQRTMHQQIRKFKFNNLRPMIE